MMGFAAAQLILHAAMIRTDFLIENLCTSRALAENPANHGDNATISAPANQTNNEKRLSSDQRVGAGSRNFLKSSHTPN
jgi:hypothetical protein